MAAKRIDWWVWVLAALPAVMAVGQLGRLHPDEVFQYLEPAYQRAFGYGIVAWEWQTGLRNWAIPGLFAYLLKACAAIGIDDPWKRRAVLAVPQFFLHAAMLFSVIRFTARRLDPALARWAALLVGLYMPVLTFAGRTMSESFSTAFLVIGLEFLDRPAAQAKRWLAPLLGGALLGLAVVARYGSAAAIIGPMVWLLVSRRWREFAAASVAGTAVAIALGALDLSTWGDWFHSFRAYYAFNVQSGQAAAQFGAEPIWFYLPFLGYLAPWAWPGFLRWFRHPAERGSLFLAAAVSYLAAITWVPHKEARFLYPALVLLIVAAAPAALQLLARWQKSWPIAVAAALSLAFFPFETPWSPQRPEQFRLEAKAGRDATGFFLIPEGVWGSGGFYWLGKNIPWFTCDFPEDPRFVQAMHTPAFNRVVSWEKHGDAELKAAGFRVLDEQGKATLYAR